MWKSKYVTAKNVYLMYSRGGSYGSEVSSPAPATNSGLTPLPTAPDIQTLCQNQSLCQNQLLILGGTNRKECPEAMYDQAIDWTDPAVFVIPNYQSTVVYKDAGTFDARKSLIDETVQNPRGINGDFLESSLWDQLQNNCFDLIVFDWSTIDFISLPKFWNVRYDIMKKLKLGGSFWFNKEEFYSKMKKEMKAHSRGERELSDEDCKSMIDANFYPHTVRLYIGMPFKSTRDKLHNKPPKKGLKYGETGEFICVRREI